MYGYVLRITRSNSLMGTGYLYPIPKGYPYPVPVPGTVEARVPLCCISFWLPV